MKISNYSKFSFILLAFYHSVITAEERRYVDQNVSACASLHFTCKAHETFFDQQGCGCQTSAAFEYRYISDSVETCLTLLFDCKSGEYPFFNQQGCGCRKPAVLPDCQSFVK